jgi:nucleotide-binding universal stress UspA family protein
MNRIVVGVDDPDQSRDLVHWAARLATELHCPITVVHAVHRSEAWMLASVQLDYVKYIRSARRRLMNDVVTSLRACGLRVDLRVELGDPAHRIAAIARQTGADLILLGSTPHGLLRELVGGGVEHRLERLTQIPVVVVPNHHATAHVSH